MKYPIISPSARRNMAWRCYMLAAVAMVFSVCFQTRVSCTNNVAEQPSGSDTVCNTSECNSTAAMMMRKMNLSADPCQDFNEFACGRYIAEAVIPDGLSSNGPTSVLGVENKLILLDILNNTDPNEPPYMSKLRGYFLSCMNEDQIEAVGLTPYLNDHTFSDDWPTLNPNWSEANFDFKDTLARYLTVFVTPIFGIDIAKDLLGDTNALYIVTGSFELGESSMKKGRSSPEVMAYLNYLVEFAVALNVSRAVAEQDANQVVDLEIEIAQIITPWPSDLTTLYNPMKLKQADELYPRLGIVQAIRAVFSAVNISLADDDKIVIVDPSYIKDLESVLECTSTRTIQNLFGFRYALLRLWGLTRRMRQIQLTFDQETQGIATEKPRWEDCVESTSQTFWEGISKQFVNRKFSETAKNKINEMIDELKDELKQMIEQVTWMGNATRTQALRKLELMKRKIGYPDINFDDAYIERLYENLTISEDNYYNNIIIDQQRGEREKLASYGQPVNRDKWLIHPYKVNAYFSPLDNEIVFMAGILQPPFFSVSYPDYVNYGSMGLVIGHEITHGFDSEGSEFDENGTLRNWWTEEDREQFDNRLQCIVDHFSQFYIEEINMTVNGEKTKTESEAEIAGLKTSLRAYRQHVLRHGQQPRLPGLNLSQDQLYFLAYAQWLHIMIYFHYRPQTQSLANLAVWGISNIRLGNHISAALKLFLVCWFPFQYSLLYGRTGSIDHFSSVFMNRLIGTLQNSEDFARAYNCTRGSYMNPERKCSVW